MYDIWVGGGALCLRHGRLTAMNALGRRFELDSVRLP